MKIGDLIKHKDFEKYAIILDMIYPDCGPGAYFIILWAGELATDWIWDDMVEKV